MLTFGKVENWLKKFQGFYRVGDMELTAKLIRDKFNYDPNTGVLSWKRTGKEAGWIADYSYRRVKLNKRKYYAHRLIWLYVYGELPVEQIDHINHDRADNRLSNLRACSRTENQRNRSINKNNKSGVSGVCWDKTKGKWQARMWILGKNKNLGEFRCITAAMLCRKEAEFILGYHPNHGT